MKTENTEKIAESIVIRREELIEKIVDGWSEEERLGFHIYGDEHGLSFCDDSGWDLFEEGPDDDELIREPFLAGELSRGELIELAAKAIDSFYGYRGFARAWYLNANGDLQLDLDEFGCEIEN